MILHAKPSREQTLNYLAEASIFGNLGLFIGAGFSKAASGNETALSWMELIERSAQNLGIFHEANRFIGKSFPEIASSICDDISTGGEIAYSDAVLKLKVEISRLTNWLPKEELRDELRKYLLSIDPIWIITTNYDLVIETLLTGKCTSLDPDDRLLTDKSFIPVYHLHGIRTYPETLIITQEDYVALFRPNEYRQLKLALTIKESTTLILGYGLGDVNVLTAVDWSKKVFEDKKIERKYPHEIVQILWKIESNPEPYRDKNDILIIETTDLQAFLAEFYEVLKTKKRERLERLRQLRDIVKQLQEPTDNLVSSFIDNKSFRIKTLGLLSKYENYLIYDFFVFFRKVIEETFRRSEAWGAFRGYAQNLQIIVDFFIKFDIKRMQPALFEILADSFERIGIFVGPLRGQSWEAHDLWIGVKNEIPEQTIQELRNNAKMKGYIQTERLLSM